MNENRTARTENSAPGPVEFAIDLPSDLGQIEAAVSYLVARCRVYGFDGPRLELNFRVGVTEALANAILYGNSRDPEKTVRIEVALDDRKVEIRVVDEGGGFDPEVIPDPTAPENLEEPGGRGLFLIRHLMDGIEFNDSGNSVRMILFRKDPELRGSRGR